MLAEFTELAGLIYNIKVNYIYYMHFYKNLLLWHNESSLSMRIQMFNNRIYDISRILDKIDKLRPESFRINNNIYLLPCNKKCKNIEEVEKTFIEDPDSFYQWPRCYAVNSSEDGWDCLVSKDEGIGFHRIDLHPFTLVNDFLTQIILIELWKWEEDFEKQKSQE